jgi:antitoxin (DNA-binding transcriptional repressor) of toxin-antitoxin stability system
MRELPLDQPPHRWVFHVPHKIAIHSMQDRLRGVYNGAVTKNVIHISEAEAASNFASLITRVSAGAEIVIEKDKQPIAVLHPAGPVRRTLSECIALLPEDSTATIDPDFSRDVEAAVASLRDPLNPPGAAYAGGWHRP